MAKKVKCITCKSKISPNARACPKCGETEIPQVIDTIFGIKKWKVAVGTILFCLFVLPLILAVLGGSSSSTSETVSSSSNSQSAPPPKSKELTIKEKNDAMIAQAQKEFELEKLVYPIDKENYPKFYRVWGDDGITRVNNAMYDAVIQGSRNKACDNPYDVGVSEKSLSDTQIYFFVNCDNGRQILVSESVALNGGDTQVVK